MPEGDLLQKLMAQTLSRHPSKDGRSWYIRTLVDATGGGWDKTDTAISPKLSKLESKEAALHGQAVEVGAFKMTMAGTPEIESGACIIAVDGSMTTEYTVYYVIPEVYDGYCTEQRCFLKPVNKD